MSVIVNGLARRKSAPKGVFETFRGLDWKRFRFPLEFGQLRYYFGRIVGSKNRW